MTGAKRSKWLQTKVGKEYVRRVNKARKESNKRLLQSFLKSCVDCGIADPDVLQFDHRPRTTKIRNVTQMIHFSTKQLLAEIAKCDIRCANCHVKITKRRARDRSVI